jgi:hypothetical protein
MSPQTGRTLAAMLDAQATTSWLVYVAARIATVDMLVSFGVDPASANAVASALANAAEARAALHPGQGSAVPRPDEPATQRSRPQLSTPLPKDPTTPAGASTVVSRIAPSRSDAAVYAARAVAQMSSAIQIFMAERPGTPLPAPMLAAAVIVSAAAREALPVPRR